MSILLGIVIFIVMILVFLAHGTYKEKQEAKEAKQRDLDRPQNEALFFERYVEMGIFDYEMEDDVITATIKLAKDCNLISKNTDNRDKQAYMMLQDVIHKKERSGKGKQQLRKKQRELEKAVWAELTAYAKLSPKDKLQTMFADAMQGGTSTPKPLQTQETSDGMIQAGAAAGIGGPIPAILSLSQTAERNARIEERNKEIDAINSVVYGISADAQIAERKMKEMAKRFAGKKSQICRKTRCFNIFTLKVRKSGLTANMIPAHFL